MTNNPYQAYQKTQIETASQGTLILMLFDGAIKFCKNAHQAMEQKDYETANNSIIKAQAIINELILTLDTEAGGEVAQNLYLIYDYIYWRLINANIKKSSEILVEILGKITDLRQTWEEVIKLSRNASPKADGVNMEA